MRGGAWSSKDRPRQALHASIREWRLCALPVLCSAHPYFSTLLAKGYVALGEGQTGLDVVADALDFVDRSGGHWCEAELYRLKGELQLARQIPQPDAAETEFVQAIALARRQQAKSWELRATVSLCRLWQHQGKVVEAYQRLSEIHSWFTEGFDTPDIKEAKALLEELS